MRKLIATLSGILMIAAGISGVAGAAPKQQKVDGSIAMMLPFPQDPNACYSGAHRRVAVATQEMVNGVIGYHFDVDPATWNKKFKLDVTGGQGDVDLDITFYSEFGTVDQATDTAYAPYNLGYETRKPGGETGVVPKDMTKVIVCMWNGQNATFTYLAGKGVK